MAEARQKRADREYSGVGLPHFQSVRLSAPRAIRSRRAIREEFLNKNDVAFSDTWAGSYQVGYVDFSLLKKIGHRFSGISDMGLEARVARMRGRIRGAERWNLAGRDDVHRNPDRASRLLYCSRS